MKRKLFTLALALFLLASMAVALPTAADGELFTRNPGFESFTGETPDYWSGLGISGITQGTGEAPAQSGSYYASLSDNSIYTTVTGLEGNTNYNFSFYVRSSVVNAGYLDIRFYRGGKTYEQWCIDNSVKFAAGEQQFQVNFGAAKEGDDRLAWRKTEYNFTTPEGVTSMTVTVYAKQSDTYLAVDSFSMTATGDVPNLVRNGRFNALNDKGAPGGWTPSEEPGDKITFPNDNGNTYFKATAGGRTMYTGLAIPGGQRYKLTLRYKSATASYKPTVRLYYGSSAPAGGYNEVIPAPIANNSANAWHYYTMYFTTPLNTESDKYTNYNITLYAPATDNWGEYYYDDVVVLPDEGASVGFFRKNVVSSYDSTRLVLWHKGDPVTTIAGDGTGYYSWEKVGGQWPLTATGCYRPQGSGEEGYTLIITLYRVDKTTGDRSLVAVSSASDTTTGGVPKLITATMNAGSTLSGSESYTYEAKSFLWSSLDGADGMQALCGAATIPYN